MKYDPVKSVIGSLVGGSVWRRKVFYAALGLLFLREWHVKRELRRLIGGMPRPAKVLDAGSGFGQYSYYCARRFPWVDIVAVDVKREQIDDCKAFFRKAGIPNARFEVQDLYEIEYEEEFDLVLSVDVMEHIPDDVRVFRNLHRALKSGGVLLVNTPSDLGGSDVHAEGGRSFVEEHARSGYGIREIREKLEAAGFFVEKANYTYGRWGSPAWKLGIKIPMRMLGVSKLFFVILPLYYLVMLPLLLPLMALDYSRPNERGTGLLVVARKA